MNRLFGALLLLLSGTAGADAPVVRAYQTTTEAFGGAWSDVWYRPWPVGELGYLVAFGSVVLWKAGAAPCPQPIRFAACGYAVHGRRHFVTANIAGAVADTRLCVSGSSIAEASLALGIVPEPSGGVLGDACNLRGDGTCPAPMQPLFWGIHRQNRGKHPTTVLTDDLTRFGESSLPFTEVAPAGCGPPRS